MKLKKSAFFAFSILSFSGLAHGCCGICEPDAAFYHQQRLLDDAHDRRQQQQNDARLAQYVAELEAAEQRRRTLIEQQRLLDDAQRRKRQEREDAAIAQRIAEAELAEERRRAAREQERLLEENRRKHRQEERDAELARQLAQEEYRAQQRENIAEQQRLLDEANRRKVQEQRDAELARQLAAEELRTPAAAQSATQRPGATTTVAISTSALPRATTPALKNWEQANDILPRNITPNDVLCAVCFSTPQDLEGHTLIKLPCKHVFCRDCVHSMIAYKQGQLPCPTCRQQSDIERLRSLTATQR